MNKYKIVYRTLAGICKTFTTTAKDEENAKDIFFREIDGRIITIEKV